MSHWDEWSDVLWRWCDDSFICSLDILRPGDDPPEDCSGCWHSSPSLHWNSGTVPWRGRTQGLLWQFWRYNLELLRRDKYPKAPFLYRLLLRLSTTLKWIWIWAHSVSQVWSVITYRDSKRNTHWSIFMTKGWKVIWWCAGDRVVQGGDVVSNEDDGEVWVTTIWQGAGAGTGDVRCPVLGSLQLDTLPGGCWAQCSGNYFLGHV